MNLQWNAIDTTNDSLSDPRWLNFSTLQSNSTQNAQHRMHNTNGWETLIRPPNQDPEHPNNQRNYFPELLTKAPVDGQAPSVQIDTTEGLAAAVQDLQVVFKPGGTRAITRQRTHSTEWIGTVQQIIIDHSNAVSAQYLHHLKAAAQSLVDQSEIGDVIGVIAVSDTVTSLQALTRIDSEATRDQLIAVIETIQPSVGDAVTGQALETALREMQASQLFDQFEHAAYLFTHGTQAVDDRPLREISADLTHDDVLLFILGDNQDVAVNHDLHEAAEATGGEFYRAATPRRLQQALETIHQDFSPTVDVTIAHAFLQFEQTTEIRFYLDEQLADIEITVEFEGALDSLQITLQNPQGTSELLTFAQCQDVRQEAENGVELYHFCTKKLQHPLSGFWTMQLQSTQVGEAEATVTVSALPKNNADSFFASIRTEEPQPVAIGQELTVLATLNADFPVTNLQVSGWIETEDEQLLSMQLRDDGIAPDRDAEDGVYTGSFIPQEAGKYLVFVEFDNISNSAQYSDFGLAYAPDQEGNVPEQQLTPVDYVFQRFSLNKVWVVE